LDSCCGGAGWHVASSWRVDFPMWVTGPVSPEYAADSLGYRRPHPISLDSAFPNGGMAVNYGGGDGQETDEGEVRWGRNLGAEWAGGATGAVERAAEDRAGPAGAPRRAARCGVPRKPSPGP